MKALSVSQPWAQLLILGLKQYDVRRWQAKFRGPLLIHASKGFSEAARRLCREQPYRQLLAGAGINSTADLPTGALIGTVQLEDCLATDQLRYERADPAELALGDFRHGYWAWKLTQPQAFAVPIPFSGVLWMFDVADALVAHAPPAAK